MISLMDACYADVSNIRQHTALMSMQLKNAAKAGVLRAVKSELLC